MGLRRRGGHIEDGVEVREGLVIVSSAGRGPPRGAHDVAVSWGYGRGIWWSEGGMVWMLVVVVVVDGG